MEKLKISEIAGALGTACPVEGEVLSLGPRSQMRVRFSDGERLLDAQVCLRAAVLRKL